VNYRTISLCVITADLWARSDVYVEVWCEKDALAGVLMPVTREYDVPLMVARGYSSKTCAYSAAEVMRATEKPCRVYYVGDFDPTGWQMARNLEEKLVEFRAPVRFRRLTVNQIRLWALQRYRIPAVRRSLLSSAAVRSRVELDAVHPDLLRGLVRDAIERHIDHTHLEALRREEGAAREALQELAQGGFACGQQADQDSIAHDILLSSNGYGNATVNLTKIALPGLMTGLERASGLSPEASKNLNFSSNRFVAPAVMMPYRFGRR
jgi:hypothetical protein